VNTNDVLVWRGIKAFKHWH